MGKKDSLAKKYMKNPTIFADFFNGFIYNGKNIIKPDALCEVDTSSIAVVPISKGGKSINIQKYRDIIKQSIVMKSDNTYFVLLGIENQSDIHYAMPVRNMLYNAISYSEQVERISTYNRNNGKCLDNSYLSGYTKEDKLIPVITVTLYWGIKPWDAPTTLKEMLIKTDETISSLVDDVDCNLFSIIDSQYLPEYQTELKELFALLRTRNNKNNMFSLVTSNESFKHISKDTAEMMRDFANIKLPRRKKDGDYDMCKAIADLTKENQIIGADNACIKHIKSLMANGNFSFEQACCLLSINSDDKERYEKIIFSE